MEIGYIKLHRQLLNWEWYDDINTFRLFTHLLLKTNYEHKKWHGVDIAIGQFLTSRESLAKQTGLTEQQVRTALTKLKSTNEITSQSTNNYTLITITNWDKWQQNNQPDTMLTTNEQPTSNQRATTTKEVKKERSKESNISIIGDFEEFWNLYTRKTNKQSAMKSYNAAIKKGIEHEAIITGIRKFAAEWSNWDDRQRQYIPHASTWLNGRRWEEEPEHKARTSNQLTDYERAIQSAVEHQVNKASNNF